MNNIPSVSELVKGTTAQFLHYHDGNLWYEIKYDETFLNGCLDTWKTFEFPVPIEDIGNATFHATERGLLMMRYVRKHIKEMEEADNG